MALTRGRWVGLAIGGCLLLLVGVLSIDFFFPKDRRTASQVELDRLRYSELVARRRAGRLASRLQLLREIDTARTHLARLPLATVRVWADSTAHSVGLDSIIGPAARAAGGAAAGLDVAVMHDPIESLYGVSTNNGSTSADYVLPARAGDRCLTVVHFGRSQMYEARRLARMQFVAEQALGPCPFYAAFGMPGIAVDQWLRAGGWALASEGAWPPRADSSMASYFRNSPRTVDQPTTADLLRELPTIGALCVAGQDDQCASGVLSRRRAMVWNGTVLAHPYGPLGYYHLAWSPLSFTGNEGTLLADMVRTLGRDRFQRFWQSSDSVPVAFEHAAGESLGSWTGRWARDAYGTVDRAAGVSAWMAATSLLFIVLGAFIGVRAGANRLYR